MFVMPNSSTQIVPAEGWWSIMPNHSEFILCCNRNSSVYDFVCRGSNREAQIVSC
jgi:hypothetical protein